jgi:hypothetical protein
MGSLKKLRESLNSHEKEIDWGRDFAQKKSLLFVLRPFISRRPRIDRHDHDMDPERWGEAGRGRERRGSIALPRVPAPPGAARRRLPSSGQRCIPRVVGPAPCPKMPPPRPMAWVRWP